MLAEGSSGSEPHPEPLGTKDATGRPRNLSEVSALGGIDGTDTS